MSKTTESLRLREQKQSSSQVSLEKGNRLTTRTDARGVVTTYSYDSVNQLLSRKYTHDASVTFQYDRVGKRKLMQDATGSTTYTFDALNQTLTVTNGASQLVSYSYDPRQLRATMTAPSGDVFTYQYDAAQRLTLLQNAQGDVTTFGYDAEAERGQVSLFPQYTAWLCVIRRVKTATQSARSFPADCEGCNA